MEPKDAEVAHLREALTLYAEWFGGIRDEECPQGDTCECHKGQLTNTAPGGRRYPMTIADELRGLSETIVEVAIEFASSSLTAAELGGSLCGLSARAANLATRCEGLVSLEDVEKAVRRVLLRGWLCGGAANDVVEAIMDHLTAKEAERHAR